MYKFLAKLLSDISSTTLSVKSLSCKTMKQVKCNEEFMLCLCVTCMAKNNVYDQQFVTDCLFNQ